jgi:hypothetical protein
VAKHIVPHEHCMGCDKRGFYDEHDAAKALGRAKTHRSRLADRAVGTRRGLIRENRYYECPAGWFHLTGMSRRYVRA